MKDSIRIIPIALSVLFACHRNQDRADAYGNFEAVEVIISAEAQGRILAFEATEGTSLEKGEIFAVIDSTQLQLNKDQLESGRASLQAKLKTLDAQVHASRVQLRNLVREQERVDRLMNGGAATSKQKDDIEGQVELLKAQIEAMETQKASVRSEQVTLGIRISEVEERIAKCRVASPQSGTLLTKYKEAGELAAPGQPLCKIAGLDQLILRAYVSEDQLSSVGIGDEVRVGYDAGQSIEEIPGKVIWVASEAEFTPKLIQTREERVNLVYAIKVSVPNDGSLKIGMPGEVYFH